MHLIYAESLASARSFALHHELMPGDWQWLRDPGVLRQYPRADIDLAPRWDAHPQRAAIDGMLQHLVKAHRVGSLIDHSGGASRIGVSSG